MIVTVSVAMFGTGCAIDGWLDIDDPDIVDPESLEDRAGAEVHAIFLSISC